MYMYKSKKRGIKQRRTRKRKYNNRKMRFRTRKNKYRTAGASEYKPTSFPDLATMNVDEFLEHAQAQHAQAQAQAAANLAQLGNNVNFSAQTAPLNNETEVSFDEYGLPLV
jgi:hypothetical protein